MADLLVTDSDAWKSLQGHALEMEDIHLQDLFADDSGRFDRFSLQLDGLLFDYSKQRINKDTLNSLVALAEQQGLQEKISQLLRGEPLNGTEGRAALHTALRSHSDESVEVDGHNVVGDVHAVRSRMHSFVEQIRGGNWRGFTGKRITDVVNIGVGGSDLGPKMVCRALRSQADGILDIHFISSIDGAHAADILPKLDPESTLFVVSSKTFTTSDTMSNAAAARVWLTLAAEAIVGEMDVTSHHFVAATADIEKAVEWGLPEENIFCFWEWVGGRYSMWSSIGLPIALYLGEDAFDEMLEGAWLVDNHFSSAPPLENIPVLMGLLGVWNTNFLGMPGHVVLPYAAHLNHFSSYLEQLEMESLGKSVTLDGKRVDYDTGPIVWGGVGSNAQHAFYQLLHQGTRFAPMDFVLPIEPAGADPEQYKLTIANCLAQSRAFMVGQESDDPYLRHDGNRVSSTFLLDALTPNSLGMLVALYEHKVFVQSVIWNINPFDQFGVELGKQVAGEIHHDLLDTESALDRYDSSTSGLLDRVRRRE